MYLIDLKKYKENLISLGKTAKQKKFIEDAFSRWYLNEDKIYDILPIKNCLCSLDLSYANINKNTKFDIGDIIEKSNKFHKNLLDTVNCKEFTNSSLVFTKTQIKRLKLLYAKTNKAPNNEFGNNITLLSNLYEIIGINNLQLSIPPIIKGIELFGSPQNTHNDEYCSPFEIEQKFGSSGSFWDYKFHKDGIYLCNPPFDDNFINKMCMKLKKDIENTKHNITIIITIPVWNSESQQEIGVKDYDIEFKGYDMLISSPFMKEHRILDQNIYKYWNYYTHNLVSVCWTHLIIWSSSDAEFIKFNTDAFLDKWKNAPTRL